MSPRRGPRRRPSSPRPRGPKPGGRTLRRGPGPRIVAGEFGGRRLVAPGGTVTRPTSDRVRESIFNTLGSMGAVEGARVLDLFAGTGALGIEAVSRGAAEAVLVERDREAIDCLEESLELLDLDDRVAIVRADAMGWSAPVGHRFDLVLADPPYDFDDWDQLLESVPGDLFVAESRSEVSASGPWEIVRSKSYGAAHVTILERGVTPDH